MLRRFVAGFALAVCLATGAASGCDGNGQPDVPHGSGGMGGLGGGGGSSGLPDGSSGDGAVTDSGDAATNDAPLSPVRVGIMPIAKPSDGGASAADQTEALLDVISLGSRGVSFVRRWDVLYSSPTEPDPQKWQQLGAVASQFHDAGQGVLLSLAVVDRTLDARPSGLSGSWNDPATQTALDAMIDRVYATFGDELVALTFGNEIDRWLTHASSADRADMVQLLTHAVAHAKTSPSRPAATVVGVALTSDAIVAGMPAEVPSLVALGDVVVATYVPLDTSYHVRPVATASSDLDALVNASSSDAGEAGSLRPVWIQEIGYPNAADCGSTVEQQAAFFDAVLQALLTRRERFPFVSVDGLYDADPSSCDGEATALGAPGNATAAAARCSLGLRDASGGNRPAYASVLETLATFAAP